VFRHSVGTLSNVRVPEWRPRCVIRARSVVHSTVVVSARVLPHLEIMWRVTLFIFRCRWARWDAEIVLWLRACCNLPCARSVRKTSASRDVQSPLPTNLETRWMTLIMEHATPCSRPRPKSFRLAGAVLRLLRRPNTLDPKWSKFRAAVYLWSPYPWHRLRYPVVRKSSRKPCGR